ncbi:zinc finger CW-type PWWP domain protein 2-like isoform X2 [Narcine bancroftii]|uniref:zinc finger CW-type PWWP domain protein 2-like isoform X2 n=1 Tax=Narcine bancroftii TaxID=1343680 RepID=UPI0038316F63
MDLSDNEFYADKLWIQCEYEDCLKWRLLANKDVTFVDLSKPWYCHMNNDSWFNCCSVPEESYPEESEFHQHGLKLVYSQLPVGTLVLAKMSGWPRWPSILCPNVFTGEYVKYDKDGFVEQYHMEFLGKPHTRSWISAEDCSRSRKWYKRALEEARMLLELTPEERLKMCKLSNEGLKKSYNRKNRNYMQNKSMAEEKENMVKEYHQSNGWIRKSMSGKSKPKLQKSPPIIDRNGMLANDTRDILQAEDLLQDLEKMLKQINESDKVTGSLMLEKQDSDKKHGQKNKLAKWSVAVSKGAELKDSTGAEDCIVIDGIEFRTEECIEEISNQLKEIDVIMAELE